MKVPTILCSAIWYNDGTPYEHQPRNIETGLVVCGLRHCNCFAVGSKLAMYSHSRVQGFLTSDNRFVTRQEALIIARASGQFPEDAKSISRKDLMSEDLW